MNGAVRRLLPPFAMFLICFVVALVVIAYMLRLFFAAGKNAA